MIAIEVATIQVVAIIIAIATIVVVLVFRRSNTTGNCQCCGPHAEPPTQNIKWTIVGMQQFNNNAIGDVHKAYLNVTTVMP